jgi:hypothetical protein
MNNLDIADMAPTLAPLISTALLAGAPARHWLWPTLQAQVLRTPVPERIFLYV